MRTVEFILHPRFPAMIGMSILLLAATSWVLALVCYSITFQFAGWGHRGEIRCANNLSQLHKTLEVYAARTGGRYPKETGSHLWLKFQEMQPPLIDENERDVYFCDVKGGYGDPGTTDYRGPTVFIGSRRGGDPIGADKEGNHGEHEGGNVLLRNGSIREPFYSDELWVECLTKLSP